MSSDRSGVTGRFTWPVRRRTPPGPEGTAEDIAVQDLAEREAAEQRLPPPEPEPLIEPPRFNLAAFRLAALGLAIVLALALAMVRLFVGGPPSVADLRDQAGIVSWTELPIGVKDDQPGLALRDKNGRWSGFDVDIAYMIAEDLGFRRSEVRFYSIESEDRPRMQATAADGARVPVKLVIASFSITPKRIAEGVRFSAPYLYTEQSVLTMKGSIPKVSSIADLRGKRVCSISASTSLDAPEDEKAVVVPRNKISECIADLRAGRVQAVTTDAAILAGFKDRTPDDFDHWDVGLDPTERYGINVGENPALQKLVDLTLYRSYTDPKDSRWEEAYDRNLQSEVDKNGKAPIAVAEQPRVTRPAIREQPWEDVFGE
ncbi:transporter substrate-binding domain-containing protein [Actinoplanes sp. TRM 88003]|uniref:Transporter substrate-binding domain-containing protein n=1 Tax=Paractinoplanes aksuensis TaxID=2939490 RepID=A0ABT1DQE5_9ACTN|nr:transporter substrate-binding domain-containing protein [Actinoplanes aksuensis]MCO8273057.1 transporter substrate-binding domain-containing protein [Actinoplanes aksuensis]